MPKSNTTARQHAVCRDCGQRMDPGRGCTVRSWTLPGLRIYDRIPNGDAVCHDCNAGPGQIHHYGCDTERCPACGAQMISCGFRCRMEVKK